MIPTESSLVAYDPATMIESLDSSGVGLRVAFVKQGDRYAQLIYIVGAANRAALFCKSQEGIASDVWPPSAPLQSLSIEHRATSSVALLVGMAGRSHWSASVEAIPGQCRLLFDIACRVGSDSPQLGSSYLWPATLAATQEANTLTIAVSPEQRLRFTCGEGSQFALEAAGCRVTQFDSTKKPVRWQYALELRAGGFTPPVSVRS